MPSAGPGMFFDTVADRYDRHRPAYPQELVDRACETAGLRPGDPVLEVGCGSGKLTRALLERGLHVTAVEPGSRLIARARDRLAGAGVDTIRFVNTRLEDAALPFAHFRAAFSAAAIHWIDADVGWSIIADALADEGTLALLSHFGADDPRSAADQRALRDAIAQSAPEVAAGLPTQRDVGDMLAGAAARRANVSETWAWLGNYDIGRGYAAGLFGDADLATVPVLIEQDGPELVALLGTMSFWARLTSGQQKALSHAIEAVHARLGRPIRSSVVACLLTARRERRSCREHVAAV